MLNRLVSKMISILINTFNEPRTIKKSIESIYKNICEFHEKYLKKYGVKLPKLYNDKRKYHYRCTITIKKT